VPGIVQRTLVSPPRSKFGPVDQSQRDTLFTRSPIRGVYDSAVDRESAYEKLLAREEARLETLEKQQEQKVTQKTAGSSTGRQSVAEAFTKSIARAIGSSLGRQIIRGILGSITGRK
jgi:hypothetical protein